MSKFLTLMESPQHRLHAAANFIKVQSVCVRSQGGLKKGRRTNLPNNLQDRVHHRCKKTTNAQPMWDMQSTTLASPVAESYSGHNTW